MTEHENGKTAQRIVMSFPCPIKPYESSMAEEILATPPTFKRIWFHTTEVKSEICSNGWNPEKNNNSIYGTAIYLSRKKWDLDDLFCDHASPPDLETLVNGLRHPKMFACVLALQANEVQSSFPLEHAPNGNTGDHLLEYLNKNVPLDKSAHRGVKRIGIDNAAKSRQFSRTSGRGDNKQNKKIACYFLTKGIKAIRFLEHGEEVVAVFDPSCIRVLPKSTSFDVHPFSDILAASDPGLPIP
jgi:hypothetical protein